MFLAPQPALTGCTKLGIVQAAVDTRHRPLAEKNMGTRRTPPFSLEGSREVLEEMSRPPEDTPERRATFERVRAMAALRKRSALSSDPAEVPR